MRITFLLLCIIIISCNAGKSPAANKQAIGQAKSIRADSMQVDITNKFVTGQFNFHNRTDFVQVADTDANKKVYLQKKTYHAFKKMADSARKDGITLVIVSGTRNFNYQKSIWEHKWQTFKAPSELKKALKILKFSSMPMTSRHHWGTDLDLNNLNNSYFEKGKGFKEYQWLKAHANHFGFYQPYTNKTLHGRTGYEEEKWHWSYMPLASKYLAYYNKHITDQDIKGFDGAALAPKIEMVKHYVDGVSLKVKQYGK